MSDEPVYLDVDGVLDLHTFLPDEVVDVVREYLEVCRERGLRHVRIIHGKGKGVQRNAVRSLLEKLPYVTSYGDADVTGGGWGATLVDLMPLEKE